MKSLLISSYRRCASLLFIPRLLPLLQLGLLVCRKYQVRWEKIPICKQYLWKQLLNGKSPVEFTSLGRWWGNDPIEKSQAEIDIIGEQDKSTALLGECKWMNEKVDLGILEKFMKRSRLFSYKHVHFYLFSKSGFTKGCTEEANRFGNVTLVSYADIVSHIVS